MGTPNYLLAPTTAVASEDDVHAPASATAAVVEYDAVEGECHCISGLAWSYSGAPVGGRISIEVGAEVVFDVGVTAAGAGVIEFKVAKKGAAGEAMTITLASGGGGISGKLSILAHWTEVLSPTGA